MQTYTISSTNLPEILNAVTKSYKPVQIIKEEKAYVVISAEQYEKFMDALEDEFLGKEAENRLAAPEQETISHAELLKKFGITEEELANVEVEIDGMDN